MKKKLYTRLAVLSIITSALLISSGIFIYAQYAGAALSNGEDSAKQSQDTLRGITFPIPELGNCASKDACHAYCDDTVNIDACVSFAQLHGLMSKEEASHAQKFKKQLQSAGGPGSCKNPQDCQAFCSQTANLEVCIKFAKESGIKDQNVDQGEKILAYIKSGGHMPGDCSSKESCQAYCSDFGHAQECFAFAKDAGIAQIHNESKGNGGRGASYQDNEDNGPTPQQMEKFLELAKTGKTPGACKTKDECESYCSQDAHQDECLTFAVSAGILTQDQVNNIRKGDNGGPGGCKSQDACRAYCNDQAHRDECFKFAEDRGFIDHNEATQTKDGLVRLRAGLNQAPPEVAECLKTIVGPSVIDDIQSGKLVPDPEVGTAVKSCFEKFGDHGDAAEPFKKAPPEIVACLKEKLGTEFDDVRSGKIVPTPEMGDAVRVCFQQAQIQEEAGQNNQNGQMGDNGHRGPGIFSKAPSGEAVRHFIQTAPPKIIPCIKEQLGDDFNKIQGGQDVQVDPAKLKVCFEEFRPYHEEQKSNDSQNTNDNPSRNRQEGPIGFLRNAPPRVTECVKEQIGDDFTKLQSGELHPTPEMEQKMRPCFEKNKPHPSKESQPPHTSEGQLNPEGQQQPLPPAYAECIKSVLGENGEVSMRSGQVTPDEKDQISICAEKFNKPQLPSAPSGQEYRDNSFSQHQRPFGSQGRPSDSPSEDQQPTNEKQQPSHNPPFDFKREESHGLPPENSASPSSNNPPANKQPEQQNPPPGPSSPQPSAPISKIQSNFLLSMLQSFSTLVRLLFFQK